MGREFFSGKVGRRLRELTDTSESESDSSPDAPDWYDPRLDPLHPSSDNEFTDGRDPTDEGGTVVEQFAKSHHGREVYHLQEDGFALADSQRSMTIVQKRIYLTAKAYWQSKERDEAETSNNHNPSTNASKYV